MNMPRFSHSPCGAWVGAAGVVAGERSGREVVMMLARPDLQIVDIRGGQ